MPKHILISLITGIPVYNQINNPIGKFMTTYILRQSLTGGEKFDIPPALIAA